MCLGGGLVGGGGWLGGGGCGGGGRGRGRELMLLGLRLRSLAGEGFVSDGFQGAEREKASGIVKRMRLSDLVV